MQILCISITNSRINEIFCEIRKSYGVKPVPSIPHITVRGPQKFISRKIYEEAHDIIAHENFYLKIKGIDVFFYENKYFVYLNVESPFLKKVWKKPDFPIAKFGFNPHVTIFRGEKKHADELINEYNNIFMNIKSNELSVFVEDLRQPELF